jgi:hypothetical protein
LEATMATYRNRSSRGVAGSRAMESTVELKAMTPISRLRKREVSPEAAGGGRFLGAGLDRLRRCGLAAPWCLTGLVGLAGFTNEKAAKGGRFIDMRSR